MFTGPVYNKQLPARLSGSGGNTPAEKAEFESILRNARTQMLGVLLGSQEMPGAGSSGLNPMQSRQWILEWTLRTKLNSQSPSTGKVPLPEPVSTEKAEPVNWTPSKTEQVSLLDMARQAARKYNIPNELFRKLIQTESSFDPQAKSPKGAMGLGQLMPDTTRELGLSLEGGAGSVWDPESNLDASAKYLGKLFNMYRTRGIAQREAWKFAAGAYNAGMGNISKAMERTEGTDRRTWEAVAKKLPEITGKSSRETLQYVSRLTA